MLTTKRYTVLAVINLTGFILSACETMDLEAGKGVDCAGMIFPSQQCVAHSSVTTSLACG